MIDLRRRFDRVNCGLWLAAMVAGLVLNLAGSALWWLPWVIYATHMIGYFTGRWIHTADARDREARRAEERAELEQRWRTADEVFQASMRNIERSKYK